MAQIKIYRGRTLLRLGIVDDEDYPGLLKHGLDFWYIGDRRTGGLLRRSFGALRDGKETSIFLYLHRLVWLRVQLGKSLESYPSKVELYQACGDLGRVGLQFLEDYWDCRSRNVCMGSGAKSRSSRLDISTSSPLLSEPPLTSNDDLRKIEEEHKIVKETPMTTSEAEEKARKEYEDLDNEIKW